MQHKKVPNRRKVERVLTRVMITHCILETKEMVSVNTVSNMLCSHSWFDFRTEI